MVKQALKLLMLGRISQINGQDVPIDALGRLPGDLRGRLEVRIVGSAFEDAAREHALAAAVAAGGLADRVALLPFAPDPDPHFHWASPFASPAPAVWRSHAKDAPCR